MSLPCCLEEEIKSNKKLRSDEDVEDSEIEGKEEEEIIERSSSSSEKQNLVESSVDGCCLCEVKLTKGENIETSTGASDSSYANILNTVFMIDDDTSDRNRPRLHFSSGQVCLSCKVTIRDLDFFQNKVLRLKKVLLDRASSKIERLTASSKQTNEEKSTEPEPGIRVTKEDDVDVVTEEEDETKVDTEKRMRKTRPKTKVPDIVTTEENIRPRREKPVTPMSEIERAKIKNLKSDLKFQVKRSRKNEVFVIEYLKEKAGNKYLVKWENRHETENSWEHKTKIPPSVLQVDC